MNKFRSLTLTILAGAWLAGSTVHATVSTTCADPGFCTLTELYGGASLTVDDVTFSDFALVTDVGLVSPDPALITLVGDDGGGNNPGPGFRFEGNGELEVDSFTDIAYLFTFDATDNTTSALLKDASLDAGRVSAMGDEAVWSVTARMFAGVIPELQITQETIGGGLDTSTLSDSFDFPMSETTISVVMGLELIDYDGSGPTTLDDFTYRVSLVPIPAAFPLMLMGVGAILVRGRRRVEKAAKETL